MSRTLPTLLADPERLAALRHSALLDTPAEESFDRLTRLASRVLGVPIALVNLINEDRQFFKSAVGMGDLRELPVGTGVCSFALSSGEPLIIEDARLDPRFASNLIVCEFGFVAYIGIPLVTSAGHALGTFCIVDTESRSWTEEELAILRDLAASVMTEIELRFAVSEVERQAEELRNILEELRTSEEELREQNEALRGSEERFQLIAENIREVFWITDPVADRVVYISPAFEEIWGCSLESGFPERSAFLESVHPEDQARVIATSDRMPRGMYEEDYRIIRPDGEIRWIHDHGFPVFDGRGEVYRIVGVAEDVTERKHAEEALHRSEERFQLVARASDDALWEYDWQTNTLWWSENFSRLFGYPAGETGVDFESWPERVHPEDRERVVAGIRATVEEGRQVWADEYRFRRADGSYAHVFDRGHVVYDLAGEPLRQIGSVMDISERKRAEEAQRLLAEAGVVLASSLDYRKTLQSIARLVVPTLADHCLVDLADREGRVELVEMAFAQPPKRSIAERLRQHYAPGSHPPEAAARVLRVREPLLFPDLSDEQLVQYARDAEHLDLLRELGIRSMVAVPLSVRGRILGAITLTAGESGRRFGPHDLALAEEIARRAALAVDNAWLYQQAQQATWAREEVLAVVSHELRSPLNAILLIIETLLDFRSRESWTEAERQQLESIRRSAGQMSRLTQDLMDITRIESGHLSIHASRQEVAPLLGEALAMLQPLAAARSLKLSTALPQKIPAVRADGPRILQVLSNLIGNAIRVVPEGGAISVAVEAQGERVRFSVTDRGPGIPQEHLPHLFDRYWQASRTPGDNLGLGLAIARGIVEAHGGRMEVASRVGEGSTFSFTLPVHGAEEDDLARLEEETGASAAVIMGGNGSGAGTKRVHRAARDQELRRQEETAEWRDALLNGAGSNVNGAAGAEAPLADRLREQIVSALHLGRLQVGDRLPSIREIAEKLGAPFQAAVQAYAVLEAEGLVEKRERSGVFVAPQNRLHPELLGETAGWLVEVLMGAFEHQIRIPRLPELIARLASAQGLRCVCIESNLDHLTALTVEMSRQFGFDAHALPLADLPIQEPEAEWDAEQLPPELQEADLLTTTVFHAPQIRPIAEALGKPLVIITANPEMVAAVERRLREGELTVVCVDPGFGERVLDICGERHRERVRIVLADDAESVATLDPVEPVLLTRAALQRLGSVKLRLLVPFSPSFSPLSARALAEVLVRLNLEMARP
ncbi:MAG: PAS domain-containing protein [Gemmatimonadetes bacterium]|nr:PAS domain-containing protein [Gemmatimonadota bacterium]